MYVAASDNRQISSISFECFAWKRQHRRVGELVLRQLAPECVQTREIALESEHCVQKHYLFFGKRSSSLNFVDPRE